MRTVDKIMRRELDRGSKDIRLDLIKSISIRTTRKNPSPRGGPPGKRTGRYIKSIKQNLIQTSKHRFVGRVRSDRRIARYGNELEIDLERPHFAPMFAKWAPIIQKRVNKAFKEMK